MKQKTIINIKKTVHALLVVVFLFHIPQLSAVNYYIDSESGSDSNNGQSIKTPWKTLKKVNATTFQPGDSILFKAGGVWIGKLHPKGSGTKGKPIVINTYGNGPRPLIDGDGMTGTGVLYLYNQSYWEINSLEITNNAEAEDDRRGVRIEVGNGYGVANHIYLRNLHVHHVKGINGHQRSHKRTAGIGFAVVSTKKGEARFNDILIENCLIHDCSNNGIITECVAGDRFYPQTPEWNQMKITNARIRNNTLYNIEKNAMIIRLFDGGVIENNVCFNTANGISGNTMFTCACDGTVFQYNEAFLNNSPSADGSMYDADLRSPNTYWQYSYSHNNNHGLFWSCTVQEDSNIVVRYNISQNDKGIIFCVNYPVNSLYIYNNTVFIPSHLSPIIISERNRGSRPSWPNTRKYSFQNNIIYNLSHTSTYLWNDIEDRYLRTFEANCFYGVHPSNEPDDPKKVVADPKFVSPGGAFLSTRNANGYLLQPGSPCIDAGVVINNNGGRDHWGNLLNDGKPDIGAHEFQHHQALQNILSDGIDIRL